MSHCRFAQAQRKRQSSLWLGGAQKGNRVFNCRPSFRSLEGTVVDLSFEKWLELFEITGVDLRVSTRFVNFREQVLFVPGQRISSRIGLVLCLTGRRTQYRDA